MAGVIGGCPRQERVQPLAALAAGSGCGILRLGLKDDAEAVGERLQRSGEVEPLGLHQEVERITGGLAAEAVIEAVVGAECAIHVLMTPACTDITECHPGFLAEVGAAAAKKCAACHTFEKGVMR